MLWIVGLGVVVFFVGTIKVVREVTRESYDSDAWAMGTLGIMLTIVLGFFGAGAGLGIALAIGLGLPKEWVTAEPARLVNLQSSPGIGGQVFLGTGYVGTTQYYFFYEKVGGGYRPGAIANQGNIFISEEPREDGELTSSHQEFSSGFFSVIGVQLPESRYHFRIPIGSLAKNISL